MILKAVKAAIAPHLMWVQLGLALAVVLGTIYGVHRVTTWRAAYRDLQSVKERLAAVSRDLTACTDRVTANDAAYLEALNLAQSTAAADRAASERAEHELQARLKTADAGARDLARRLLNDQVCWRRLEAASAAGAATEPAGARGESSRDARVRQATEDAFAACRRDAERLDAWREWWLDVRERWHAAGYPIEGVP